MRVDAHVHAFPERLALAVRNALNSGGTLAGGVLLDDVARGVRDAGFDRAWVLPYAHRAGVAESLNEWSAAEVPRYPWLVAGATFHPHDENMPRLVERALVELRLRVVKLHCSVGGFAPGDPRLEPLWRTAAHEHVPVVIHAGQVGPGVTEAAEVAALEPVLAAHRDLPLVLAHCGHPAAAVALGLMARYDNLYADITPVGPALTEVPAEALMRFAGRLLFGSDAPNNFVAVASQVTHAEQLAPDADVRALLMGDAAQALIP